jgi:hypothetical protein
VDSGVTVVTNMQQGNSRGTRHLEVEFCKFLINFYATDDSLIFFFIQVPVVTETHR